MPPRIFTHRTAGETAAGYRPPAPPRHYDRRDWRDRLQPRILARDPICRICGDAPSAHVDHIKPLAQGGTDHESNLRGVCASCHSRLTHRLQQTGVNEVKR